MIAVVDHGVEYAVMERTASAAGMAVGLIKSHDPPRPGQTHRRRQSGQSGADNVNPRHLKQTVPQDNREFFQP